MLMPCQLFAQKCSNCQEITKISKCSGPHTSKKVSSHLTIFDITQVSRSISSNLFIQKFIFHTQKQKKCTIWVVIFLQFNVIFIFKTSVLLNDVVGKKKVAFLINGATRHLLCCVCAVFCAHLVIQSHALKHYRPTDKKCNFFFPCTWFHKLDGFTVQFVGVHPNRRIRNFRVSMIFRDNRVWRLPIFQSWLLRFYICHFQLFL